MKLVRNIGALSAALLVFLALATVSAYAASTAVLPPLQLDASSNVKTPYGSGYLALGTADTTHGYVVPSSAAIIQGLQYTPIPNTQAATTSVLGLIKGDNSTVTLSSAGVLSLTAQNIANALGYTAVPNTQAASTSILGLIKGDNSTVTLSSAGVLSLSSQNIANALGAAPLLVTGGAMTGSIYLAPGTYDANALSRGIGFEPTSLVTVPNQQELDAFRISGTFGIGKSSGTGIGGQVAGINFQMTLDPSSDPSANMYGVIGQVRNFGKGSAKAIYGRSDCSQAQSDPTYSVCIAGQFNVNTGPNMNYAAFFNSNVITNQNGTGKPLSFAWAIASANSDGSNAAASNGILFDKIAMQTGGAFLAASAVGPGDFLDLKNAAKTADVFKVDQYGHAGIGTFPGAFGLGEALSVQGFMALGSGSVTGLLGPTGDGNLSFGSRTATPVVIQYNAASASNPTVAVFNAAGLTVTNSLGVNGVSPGSFGYGEAVSIGGFIGVGTANVAGVIGSTGNGNFVVGAQSTKTSMELRAGGQPALLLDYNGSVTGVTVSSRATAAPSGTSGGPACADSNGKLFFPGQGKQCP